MIIDTLKENWAKIEDKRRFSLFLALVLGSFLVFLFFVASILGRPLISPRESGADPKGPDAEYTREQKELEDEFLDEDKASSRVSQLAGKLPYKGANFSLSYDYDTFKFTLVLNKNNLSQALSEYDQFLKTNNVRRDLVEKNLIQQESSAF